MGETGDQNGYTKLFDLGDAAHIIPKVMGGGSTTYKCDYNWVDYNHIHVPLVGGYARHSMDAGLGNFGLSSGNNLTGVGFRSVSRFVSFS